MRPIFDDRHVQQLHLLSVWVRRAAVGSTELLAARNQAPRRGLQPPTKKQVGVVSPATFEVPTTSPEANSPASSDAVTGTDPFDPEAFNRRFHKPAVDEPAKQTLPNTLRGPD